jgi:hypothetical protein
MGAESVTTPDGASASAQALEVVKQLLLPDGADVTVADWDAVGQILRLQLVLDGVGCKDCVLPREHLEAVALDALRRANQPVVGIQIIDPRESD